MFKNKKKSKEEDIEKVKFDPQADPEVGQVDNFFFARIVDTKGNPSVKIFNTESEMEKYLRQK